MNTRNFSKATEAVSPVVATLLLVLVAAGAAIGFGVFLNGFQKDAQDNVNSDVTSQCLTIAGSSTVFEFTAVAEPLFENSQGGCDIINNAGGSGAGLQAIGIDAVDIGAMSHDPTSTDLAKYPDLNKDGKKDFGVPDLKVTRIGYDAVVPVVPAGHCAAGKKITTEAIRDIYGINGGVSGYTPVSGITGTGTGGKLTWGDVGANPTTGSNDFCAGNTVDIQPTSRSDKGGTVDVFCDKLVGNVDSDLCKAPIDNTKFPSVWISKSGATGDKMLGNQDAEALLGSSTCAAACIGYTSMAGDDTNTAITALSVDADRDATLAALPVRESGLHTKSHFPPFSSPLFACNPLSCLSPRFSSWGLAPWRTRASCQRGHRRPLLSPPGPLSVRLPSRPLAIGAFLLAVTSLLLPWWRVTHAAEGLSLRDDVWAFRPESPLTTTWGPWVTGALVVAAALLLFVRIAGRSQRYEPAVWRRDLLVAGVVMAMACASALLWPSEVPSFWGGRTYAVENVTTQVTETTMPVLGWWVALLGAALLVLAWRGAKPSVEEASVSTANP